MDHNQEIFIIPFEMVKEGGIPEIVRTHELLRVARETGAFRVAEHLEWLIEHRDSTGTWGYPQFDPSEQDEEEL